tara:strand:- start:2371 stop:3384 length:1014 start_codon:yes stop_codon:yes gene_type:complete
MFNPKSNNLLDDQLAFSGLEMNAIDPLTATFAGISAGSSILGGIFGAKKASSQNAKAKKAQKKQQKLAKKQAKATNKYNAEKFAIDKQNYYNNKLFQYKTAVKQWAYNQSIQDFEYFNVLQRYAKSVENTENQLMFNSIAAADAYAAEQSALDDIRTEDAFNKQGALIDRLQQEGQAALLPGGVSRTKAIQSRVAAAGRNAAISDASLASSVEQSQRNMRAIALQKYGSDMQARASMMIKPIKPMNIPMPEMGPDMIFMPPMKATPAYIPPAQQQSTLAPLISGFSSAATSLAGVDWGSAFGGSGGGVSNLTTSAGNMFPTAPSGYTPLPGSTYNIA